MNFDEASHIFSSYLDYSIPDVEEFESYVKLVI